MEALDLEAFIPTLGAPHDLLLDPLIEHSVRIHALFQAPERDLTLIGMLAVYGTAIKEIETTIAAQRTGAEDLRALANIVGGIPTTEGFERVIAVYREDEVTSSRTAYQLFIAEERYILEKLLDRDLSQV